MPACSRLHRCALASFLKDDAALIARIDAREYMFINVGFSGAIFRRAGREPRPVSTAKSTLSSTVTPKNALDIPVMRSISMGSSPCFQRRPQRGIATLRALFLRAFAYSAATASPKPTKSLTLVASTTCTAMTWSLGTSSPLRCAIMSSMASSIMAGS